MNFTFIFNSKIKGLEKTHKYFPYEIRQLKIPGQSAGRWVPARTSPGHSCGLNIQSKPITGIKFLNKLEKN